ncbi:hypothetical protein MT325_m309R [Paramecium bursaria chlorella virus MT325]|uniref:Uncharacterized protein m309R n=1 Tax=Paramecium bursaria Chlorella virus MT325 TaxID=346932 RepID=A7IU39_PBCVM|nr:hypothetical protein MT325_m309R [Paramecium bursaria chlorella virus MT325]
MYIMRPLESFSPEFIPSNLWANFLSGEAMRAGGAIFLLGLTRTGFCITLGATFLMGLVVFLASTGRTGLKKPVLEKKSKFKLGLFLPVEGVLAGVPRSIFSRLPMLFLRFMGVLLGVSISIFSRLPILFLRPSGVLLGVFAPPRIALSIIFSMLLLLSLFIY